MEVPAFACQGTQQAKARSEKHHGALHTVPQKSAAAPEHSVSPGYFGISLYCPAEGLHKGKWSRQGGFLSAQSLWQGLSLAGPCHCRSSAASPGQQPLRRRSTGHSPWVLHLLRALQPAGPAPSHSCSLLSLLFCPRLTCVCCRPSTPSLYSPSPLCFPSFPPPPASSPSALCELLLQC